MKVFKRLLTSSTRLTDLRLKNLNSEILPLSNFLIDNFNRKHDYLRISITERCNLRCTYCMPEEGVKLTSDENLLTTNEIIKLSEIFAKAGVRKIRLTGGEPTVRKDIIELVRNLKNIKGIEEVCITSNGLALSRKLEKLVKFGGLTGLNLSLDTLIEGKFLLITRRNGLTAVLKSLKKAIELKDDGLKIKINCVIIKGVNDDEILNFVELAKEKDIEVRFIEYMPFNGNKWSKNKLVSYMDMRKIIEAKFGKLEQLDFKNGDTAKIFKINGLKGKVGFITSMTSDFCSACTRLRLTNDGNLKVCLFGNEEINIKKLMNTGFTDEQILNEIKIAVKNKKEKHADINELNSLPNRPMILIGG